MDHVVPVLYKLKVRGVWFRNLGMAYPSAHMDMLRVRHHDGRVYDPSFVERILKKYRAANVLVTRIYLSGYYDDEEQAYRDIYFKERSRFISALDELIRMLRENEMYAVLTLLVNPSYYQNVFGGSIDDTSSPAYQKFMEFAVDIVSRYANEPAVLAFDVRNEPSLNLRDWMVTTYKTLKGYTWKPLFWSVYGSWRDLANFYFFVRHAADVIDAHVYNDTLYGNEMCFWISNAGYIPNAYLHRAWFRFTRKLSSIAMAEKKPIIITDYSVRAQGVPGGVKWDLFGYGVDSYNDPTVWTAMAEAALSSLVSVVVDWHICHAMPLEQSGTLDITTLVMYRVWKTYNTAILKTTQMKDLFTVM